MLPLDIVTPVADHAPIVRVHLFVAVTAQIMVVIDICVGNTTGSLCHLPWQAWRAVPSMLLQYETGIDRQCGRELQHHFHFLSCCQAPERGGYLCLHVWEKIGYEEDGVARLCHSKRSSARLSKLDLLVARCCLQQPQDIVGCITGDEDQG
jgi:hypothetical protein